MYVNFPYNSKDNKNTMQVYLVTAMTHVIALEAGPSSQGELKHIKAHCHFIIDMYLSSCLYSSTIIGR